MEQVLQQSFGTDYYLKKTKFTRYTDMVNTFPLQTTLTSQLIATVSEDADTDEDGSFEFHYSVPYNTYGNFIYCVVVVDQFGAYNPAITSQSCAEVDEDSDENWVKEPTNVQATFLGNRTTRVTWTDQAGVEGERYHIWRGGWRVQGAEFKVNELLLGFDGKCPGWS